MAADSQFQAGLRALVAALSEIEAPSMIIGGVAVIAAGVPRETVDIDATVLGRACSGGIRPGEAGLSRVLDGSGCR